MQAFEKINGIVDKSENRENLSEVHVIINTDKFKHCKYGKYSKPIQIIYKYSNAEDYVLENPDMLIKIPASCEDCINTLGTKYSVIIANANRQRIYVGTDGKEHSYYECSVGVIRNPLMIKKCEEIEASAYNVTEYEF